MKTQERRLTDSYIDSLYKELSKHYDQTSDATHYDNFRHKGKWLYFKGRDEPLTNEDGKLKTFGKLKSMPGKHRLCNLGFDMPSGKLTPQQSVILSKTEEELPPTSDVAKADNIELQQITEKVARSMENLIVQLEGESSKDLPMRELLGLDKQLRSIRGSLKVEVAKRVQLEQRIKKEKRKLEEIRDNPEYIDGIREDIRHRVAKLSDNLSVRQESIDLLKGRLKDQITSFKETIAKGLDKDTSLAEKI